MGRDEATDLNRPAGVPKDAIFAPDLVPGDWLVAWVWQAPDGLVYVQTAVRGANGKHGLVTHHRYDLGKLFTVMDRLRRSG